MNIQALETKIVSVLNVAEGVAKVLTDQIPTFINLADEAAKFADEGAQALKGADKLALVKAMADAALTELGLGAEFGVFWAALSPVITLLVQLRKLGIVKF
jgi:hypothetical protein